MQIKSATSLNIPATTAGDALIALMRRHEQALAREIKVANSAHALREWYSRHFPESDLQSSDASLKLSVEGVKALCEKFKAFSAKLDAELAVLTERTAHLDRQCDESALALLTAHFNLELNDVFQFPGQAKLLQVSSVYCRFPDVSENRAQISVRGHALLKSGGISKVNSFAEFTLRESEQTCSQEVS